MVPSCDSNPGKRSVSSTVVIFGGGVLVKNPLAGEGASLYAMSAGQPAASNPELATRLEFLLDGWSASAPAYQSVEMSSDTEAALRSLGYLEDEAPDEDTSEGDAEQ